MTDLFDDQDEPVVDQTKDYLSELVGEDKKFKTPQDLAKAKAESDAFIERLKAENAGLRNDLKTRLKLEEVVDRISSAKSPSSEQEPEAHEQDEAKSAITPEQIKAMVAETLTEGQKAEQRRRNNAFVEQKLQEAFGPTFRRTIKEQAQKLGIGEEFAKNLAAEQPNAFLKLFDVQTKQEANSIATQAPHSTVNSDAMRFQPESGLKRKSYYEKLRKSDKKTYWSPRVQNEMHKEAHKQGPSFFDV